MAGDTSWPTGWNSSRLTKDSTRRRDFRKVAWKLQHETRCGLERWDAGDLRVLELFRAVKKKRMAAFGLVKLQEFDLNGRYPFPAELHGGEVPQGKELVSFVEYAAMLERNPKRDSILSSLLNLRIDPFYPSEDHAEDLKFLMSIQSRVRVWLVRNYLEMKGKTTGDSQCLQCKCVQANCAWLGCGHTFCDRCVWDHIRCTKGQFFCPKCGSRLKEDVQPAPLKGTPEEIRQTSKEKFLELPIDAPPLPREKFFCCSLSKNETLLLGTTQHYRTSKFWNAALHERPIRVHILIQEGVDIDARNEYGHTALSMACWRGFKDIVDILLRSGADPSIKCNLGLTCMEIARKNNWQDIEQALKMYKYESLAVRVPNCIDPPKTEPDVTVLIPRDADHPGRGACYIDNSFSEAFLQQLSELLLSIQPVMAEKTTCSARRYLCDTTNAILNSLEQVVQYSPNNLSVVYPFMRFLSYEEQGGYLAPHVDLSRTDFSGHVSTHTFILYLEDCDQGGETSLLTLAKNFGQHGNVPAEYILSTVRPKRGRLLLFPHACPHEGRETIAVPKRLLRGEAR
mmetsp:Transcript_11254/g.20906  ORF Transcript_11254/g.20906 Transcript_11254/m.20906 type:complete len:568 (-) Transcript_11254:1366-3069(-)